MEAPSSFEWPHQGDDVTRGGEPTLEKDESQCLLAGDDVASEGVHQIDDGVDDHQTPHGQAGLHALLAVVQLVVDLDGQPAAGGVHDCGGEAEQRLQEVVGVVEEDIAG